MMEELASILVPVDGSDESVRAAHFAATLSAAAGSRLTLLCVVALDPVELLGLQAMPEAEARAEIERRSEPAFHHLAEQLGRRADPIPTDTETVAGDPAEEILGWLEANRADLVVMGCRGLSPLQGIVAESVSDRVIRRAPCPVTLVR